MYADRSGVHLRSATVPRFAPNCWVATSAPRGVGRGAPGRALSVTLPETGAGVTVEIFRGMFPEACGSGQASAN
jgi:hypothetical protein